MYMDHAEIQGFDRSRFFSQRGGIPPYRACKDDCGFHSNIEIEKHNNICNIYLSSIGENRGFDPSILFFERGGIPPYRGKPLNIVSRPGDSYA